MSKENLEKEILEKRISILNKQRDEAYDLIESINEKLYPLELESYILKTGLKIGAEFELDTTYAGILKGIISRYAIDLHGYVIYVKLYKKDGTPRIRETRIMAFQHSQLKLTNNN